jgi:hypothetical protein
MNNTGIVIVAVLAVAGALWAFSSGAKAGRKIERQARRVSGAGQAFMVSILVGLLIAVTQWTVMTVVHAPNFTTIALVLGVPGLLAGVTVGRLFAVDAVIRSEAHGSRKGARR